jgi:preprotein translocase subunit Sec61beta
MSSAQTVTSAGNVLPFARGDARRWSVDPRRAVAVALFLVVLIAEAILIAVAAPTIAEIGSLYITVT